MAATRTRKTAAKSTPKKATAKKATARKSTARAPKKTTARKTTTKKATVSRGPSDETMKNAKLVVKLRDSKKMSWSDVADETGFSPSSLRRLYTLGAGKTVGARKG